MNSCSSLRSGTASDFDSVPTSLIKETFTSLSGPLTHIFNQSFASAIVPVELTRSFVLSLFNAGDQSIFSIIDLFLFYLPFPKYWEKKKRLVYNRLFHNLSD